MHILIWVGLLWLSFILGFLVGYILRNAFRRSSGYDGIIQVIKEDEKLTYSLEFEEHPSELQYRKEVVFKVEASDESSDRK